MTFHENDWQVFVCQHLKSALELLKQGIVLRWDQRNRMFGYERRPDDYLDMIRMGMEDEMKYLEDDTITSAGCQYLQENDTILAVRGYYADPKRCRSISMDQANEWMVSHLNLTGLE